MSSMQMKGTDICADIVCPHCESYYHVDGDFFYGFTCGECGKHFLLDPTLVFTEVSKGEADYAGGVSFYLLPKDGV